MDARATARNPTESAPPDDAALPRLSADRTGQAGDAAEAAAALLDLRRFHLGGTGDLRLATLPAGTLPALVFPFADPDRVRTDYPLFVPDPARPQVGPLAVPLGELLAATARAAAGSDDGRLLTDNLLRVERFARSAVAGHVGPVDAHEVLVGAGRALQDELALAPPSAERLAAEFDAMLRALPGGGRLLGFDPTTPLHLLRAAAESRLAARRSAHRAEVQALCDGLCRLLDVERQKDERARHPDAIEGAIGARGAGLFDTAELSRLLGRQRGSVPMDRTRRRRIEQVLATLEGHLAAAPAVTLTLCVEPSFDRAGLGGAEPAWRIVEDADPCAAAAAAFAREAATFAELCRAVRTARLEVDGSYDADRHDPWLEQLDWEAFSAAELHLLPPVVALTSAPHLAAAELRSMSRLLTAGMPVQLLVVLQPAENPGSGGRDPCADFRLELGYLGIGHREALVQQSTAARPGHLVAGFARALDGTRTALHVIAPGLEQDGAPPHIGAWLHAGAAIESRAHPLFRYDPEAGATFARRLDFGGNPQPDADWPLAELRCRGADGAEETLELAFTFADFALLEPSYRGHFRLVPAGSAGDDLMPLCDYLELDRDAAAARIPFVLVVDPDGALCRVVVTRRLAQACRDRLAFWRTLQELAGVRNEFVTEAQERTREAVEANARAERDELAAAHRDEIERVRGEAVAEAMRGLARSLLDLDPAALDLAAAPARAPAPPASAEPELAPGEAESAKPAPAATAPPEPTAVTFDEPWVDTPLCTSCNDCTAINPLLFVYDANKQARLGNPAAGTYEQLVRAAEKCPARCIHPGLPTGRDEPRLDELIRRAAPFNQ